MSLYKQTLPHPPDPGNYWSIICPYTSAFSRVSYEWHQIACSLFVWLHFISPEKCFGYSAILLYGSVVDFFLLLSRCPLYKYTAICLSIHQLMAILFSSLVLFWIKILWTFTYKSFWVIYVFICLGQFPGMELLSHFIRNCWTIFQSDCIILHS